MRYTWQLLSLQSSGSWYSAINDNWTWPSERLQSIGIRGGRSITQIIILSLGTRSKWAVSFKSWPLLPRGKEHGTHRIGRWLDLWKDLCVLVNRKICFLCRGVGGGGTGPPNLVILPTSLIQFYFCSVTLRRNKIRWSRPIRMLLYVWKKWSRLKIRKNS